MANNYAFGVRSGAKYSVTSSDTKPGTARPGDTLIETDTLAKFIWDGSSWIREATTGAPAPTSATAYFQDSTAIVEDENGALLNSGTDKEDELNTAITTISGNGGGEIRVLASMSPVTGSQVTLDGAVVLRFESGAFDPLTSVSADITSWDPWLRTALVDATAAQRTVDLPDATTWPTGIDGEITIKNVGDGTNAVVVDGNGSQTIDGETTWSLATQYESLTIQSDGSNWSVM